MVPIKQGLKTLGKFVESNAGTILAIAAGIGVAATEVTSIRAGMCLEQDLVDLRFENLGEELDKKEKVKVVIKDCAVPTAIAVATIVCLAGSKVIDIRKAKTMAASYAILSESAETFRRKCIEEVGAHREDKIRNAISQEKFNEEYDKHKDEIIALGNGEGTYLFRDGITGQFFRDTPEGFSRKISKLNKYYIGGEDFVTVSEYASALGLEEPCSFIREAVWPSAMTIEPELDTVMAPTGEPAYDVYFPPEREPMYIELAENYNRNHYVSSTYDY